MDNNEIRIKLDYMMSIFGRNVFTLENYGYYRQINHTKLKELVEILNQIDNVKNKYSCLGCSANTMIKRLGELDKMYVMDEIIEEPLTDFIPEPIIEEIKIEETNNGEENGTTENTGQEISPSKKRSK